MMKKVNSILLIDDDEATNFLHKIIIKRADCAHNIVAVDSGPKALEFLNTKVNGEYPRPDIIFLDINMPIMDGWEFLEEYKKLDKKTHAAKIVVMLTTSLNPDDREKAKSLDLLDGFMNKPLTQDMLQDLLQKFHASNLK
ncbi:response regulator [Zeaxanthinibacter enoshimensis]|uniref:Response regulator receiver domain-containing protein n=1 Tax=Zeaxanthinibacter enoshimensis TaxID=392009 RepID=A0A4R6TR70_9FLAO|nr:response regulator [Zeaxanthinibacter enoshimensis]TDQ33006.1 response regulator receiver domain-containing protein [Zeaxanthinibacter enoshimensis]